MTADDACTAAVCVALLFADCGSPPLHWAATGCVCCCVCVCSRFSPCPLLLPSSDSSRCIDGSRVRLPLAVCSPPPSCPAAAMSHISADWLSREFQQNIQYNIQQVATLLHTFDTSTRFKLAQLNEKLTKIERQMEYVEASIKHVTLPENAEGGAR